MRLYVRTRSTCSSRWCSRRRAVSAEPRWRFTREITLSTCRRRRYSPHAKRRRIARRYGVCGHFRDSPERRGLSRIAVRRMPNVL